MDTIHFPDGSSMQFCRGPQAALMAPQIWTALGPKHRDMLLWDAPPKHRAALLPVALRAADLCAVGWHGNAVLGLGWTVPLMPGCRSAFVHLCFRGNRAQAEACSRSFLERVASEGRMDSLVGLVPGPFRHMRAFAVQMGFLSMGRIPGGCCLPGHGGRVTDAELFVWEVPHAA